MLLYIMEVKVSLSVSMTNIDRVSEKVSDSWFNWQSSRTFNWVTRCRTAGWLMDQSVHNKCEGRSRNGLFS